MPYNPLKPVKQVQRLADHIIKVRELHPYQTLPELAKIAVECAAKEAFRIAIEAAKGARI